MPKSHEFTKPLFGLLGISEEEWEPPTCPHCKQPIREGEKVHTWEGKTWHTKPCPS